MKSRLAPILLAAVMPILTAAAATRESGIGPYHQIHARILVAEPDHAWQAMMDWRSVQSSTGWIRLVHTVGGRIIELRWQGHTMWLRDNQAKSSDWRRIDQQELSSHGIVITPVELSTFLGGRMPAGFQATAPNRWSIHRNHSRIRVQWNRERRRLTFSDMKHARKAVILILDANEETQH